MSPLSLSTGRWTVKTAGELNFEDPMSMELASRYDPKEAQDRWYDFWERHGYFHPEPGPGRPYTIVIPPPNVTGALHMGHALNNTLQDMLIRWRRMQGYNTLWVPGTDHAGIATQAVVEKRIREQEGKTRRDLGRDALVQRIWAWKDDYERRILNQLRRLGSSCDWQRTRFTLDPICARAVRETFFRMFKDGLIYRGKRLVNWDAQLQTSVADDETYTEDTKSGFWTFKYPLTGTNEFIRFSTTRPETMLGDTAVAVHPSDPRYQHLIGRMARIPLVDREIPIIADGLLADPELGTGAVKVTPAHDMNDYQCGLRHKLPMINILNPDGTINENGGNYAGMDRYEARQWVTKDMEALGLFEGREDREIPLKFSDRSKTPIEPYLSDQWFVRMDRLAQMAMEAVSDGRVKIHPERYARTYLDWLGEKRDWCISRQLWWGHRIPVWSATRTSEAAARLVALERQSGGRLHVTRAAAAETGANELILACLAPELDGPARELEALGFEQDPDVLDTWFSSALWPHSTLGWPEQTSELRWFYPTSVLVTSRDIITLWVARMVLTGLYNCGDVPFRDVYIHPKILDGFGQTMSKTKGNGVDPLDIIDKYGADALRFTLASMSTETQDAKMPVGYECPHCQTYIAQKIEHQQMKPKDGRKPRIKCPGCKKDFQFSSPNFDPDPGEPVARVVSERFDYGRNFANKLWNAARFALMNLEGYAPIPVPPDRLAFEDRWILSRLAGAVRGATDHLDAFRFSEFAKTLYDFSWSEFCDWYVELVKLRLKDDAARPAAQRVLATVLDTLLRLLAPVVPFLTEHLWQALGAIAPQRGLPDATAAAPSITIAPWPTAPETWACPDIETRMNRLQGVIRSIRNIRSLMRIDAKARVTALVQTDAACAADLAPQFVQLLAGVDRFEAGPHVSKPAESATEVAADWELYVPLAGLIDRAAELQRLDQRREELASQVKSVRQKLANQDFIARAPQDVVERDRQRASDFEAQIAAIDKIVSELRSG
jgi:valyl-tRNA synthetase